ncbi:hypothetical protein DL764_006808 [Monosporascus ibericus]|uniref:NAD(P)-binding domain-containing protein n=1 Tax=Monosporascus ibericus TaxID=155417 RepID=A0A4Q4T7D1_9PEZI|nr:hypothetical protein DL764_006808 [Monosporascus ibericus]
MKLVIVGGTGLVATELIKQSLAMPEITSIVAVARKPVQLEADAVNESKFKSVVIRDYEEYPDTLKGGLSGADACIWLSKFDFAEVKRIMRGETEKILQEFGAEHREVDVHIVRPGMVWSSITFWRSVQANIFRATNVLTRVIPNISLTELSAAILDQVVRGFEKEALSNADLVRIGGAALKKKAKA